MTLQNFLAGLRYSRRRHRTAVLAAFVLLVVLYIVLFQTSTTAASELAINSPGEGVFEGILRLWGRKKTVPFAKTGAALQSDFNSMILSTSSLREKGTGLDVDSEFQDSLVDGIHADVNEKTKLRLVSEIHRKTDPREVRLKAGRQFYEEVFGVLYDGRPLVGPLKRYASEERIYHARYDSLTPAQLPESVKKGEEGEKNIIFTEDYLSRFLQLTESELDSMKKLHEFVVDKLPNTAPKGIYSGNGIVFVAGGKFNWLTLLSIKLIRALGSDLPIEVLIPHLDEYEPDLCARVFPALNARCIYLPHVLSEGEAGSSVSKFEFKGYQYKALAILVLSFENVLLLDSDNIPVHPPDHLFDKEPFTTHGLIVWPDFWKRATSPDYYRIAGMTVSSTQLLPTYDEVKGTYEEGPFTVEDASQTPLHQRKGTIPDPTSELGQLMILKKTHTRALLLALYYNLYGPTHFYPLFSQGSDGEGDKETFLAATCALNKPFYQVSKFLNAFGYFDSHNNFQGTGMGQYDPVEDFKVRTAQEKMGHKPLKAQEELVSKDPLLKRGAQILFVHANFPKLNPWELMKKRQIVNENGERWRLYGTGMKVRTGYDFETVQWLNMRFLLCELKIFVNTFKDVSRDALCYEINLHLDFLKSTIETLE